MSKPRDERQKDLFRPALDQIIDLGHPLVRLADKIDWGFLEEHFAAVCEPGPGQPPLPSRLIAGLFILKHTHSLSDEALCARWLENPYYQYLCGEQTFRHEVPFDRSSLTRWRQRLGRSIWRRCCRRACRWPTRRGPSRPRIWSGWRWTPPCSPQGNCAFDRRAADVPGGREAGRFGQAQGRGPAPELSQGRQAGLDHGRALYPCPSVQAGPADAQVPAHPAGTPHPRYRPQDRWRSGSRSQLRPPLLSLATRVRQQDQHQRGRKVYALHAPEVECIGKGKARAPYEFGCKVSVATPVTSPKGGQFVLHAKALHGNPGACPRA
jgi:transposase, IS5 family